MTTATDVVIPNGIISTGHNLTDMVVAVRAIADANPDYVYYAPKYNCTCVYLYKGQGSCIIGRAALALGLIDASLETKEENERWITVLFDKGIVDKGLDTQLGVVATSDIITWLWTVQQEQDDHKSWGHAVEIADSRVPGL